MDRKDIIRWMEDNPENVCCPYDDSATVGIAKCRVYHGTLHDKLDIIAKDYLCPVCGSELLSCHKCEHIPTIMMFKFECGSSFTGSCAYGCDAGLTVSGYVFVKVNSLSPLCGVSTENDII